MFVGSLTFNGIYGDFNKISVSKSLTFNGEQQTKN